MTEIFLQLVNMSISAGLMILAVLVLRFLLRKAPKAFRCVLWCMVGLKLLLPFSVESALSLIPSTEVISREILYATQPVINSGVEVVNRTMNPVWAESFAPSPGDSVNPLQVLVAVAAFVWTVGVAALLLYTMFSYFRLKKRVNGAIRFQDNIYQSEAVASPFILGVIRPCIYIPFSLKEEELQCVLAHEKAHLKRGDHLWKPLGFLILTVYWFHPLIWLAYILLSEALLNCSISHKGIAACPLAFGEVGVKQRIKNVLSYKKPAFWIVILSTIACVVCGICFLTEPRAEEQAELGVLPQTNELQEETASIGSDSEDREPTEIESDIEYREEDVSQELRLGEVFSEEVNHFDGVTMIMEKYKSTEGNVEIYNGRKKEIQYGEYFDIQVFSEGQWYSLQLPEEIAYHSLAYVVEPGTTRIWQINWEYAYGKLPAGKYRMVKDVMDYRAPGDFDKYYLAAEFEIK